jgi:hypothetical protein
MEAKERMISNKYRSSILAINEYDDTHFSALLYNEYWEGTKEIRSIQEFIKVLDELFGNEGFPMESYQKRSFLSNDEGVKGSKVGTGSVKNGKLGTFSIEIQYRNNATWQGTVTWIEKNNKEFFRSALELFFLIDSVTCCNK